MILKVINNIEEYLSIITEIKSQNMKSWFRGQSIASQRLEPSLFRNKTEIKGNKRGVPTTSDKKEFILMDDFSALEIFKKQFKKFKECEDYADIDYLYMMQHYGLPTRLLDFTTDALIALYFSVSEEIVPKKNTQDEIDDFRNKCGFSEDGSAVFCIDPINSNKITWSKSGKLIDLINYNLASLRNIEFPVCVITGNENERLRAQKGVFVYFGSRVSPYDYYEVLDKITTKIFIPNTCREEILKGLKNNYGISQSTVYPDDTGDMAEIKAEILNKFRRDCESYGIEYLYYKHG